MDNNDQGTIIASGPSAWPPSDNLPEPKKPAYKKLWIIIAIAGFSLCIVAAVLYAVTVSSANSSADRYRTELSSHLDRISKAGISHKDLLSLLNKSPKLGRTVGGSLLSKNYQEAIAQQAVQTTYTDRVKAILTYGGYDGDISFIDALDGKEGQNFVLDADSKASDAESSAQTKARNATKELHGGVTKQFEKSQLNEAIEPALARYKVLLDAAKTYRNFITNQKTNSLTEIYRTEVTHILDSVVENREQTLGDVGTAQSSSAVMRIEDLSKYKEETLKDDLYSARNAILNVQSNQDEEVDYALSAMQVASKKDPLLKSGIDTKTAGDIIYYGVQSSTRVPKKVSTSSNSVLERATVRFNLVALRRSITASSMSKNDKKHYLSAIDQAQSTLSGLEPVDEYYGRSPIESRLTKLGDAMNSIDTITGASYSGLTISFSSSPSDTAKRIKQDIASTRDDYYPQIKAYNVPESSYVTKETAQYLQQLDIIANSRLDYLDSKVDQTMELRKHTVDTKDYDNAAKPYENAQDKLVARYDAARLNFQKAQSAIVKKMKNYDTLYRLAVQQLRDIY